MFGLFLFPQNIPVQKAGRPAEFLPGTPMILFAEKM